MGMVVRMVIINKNRIIGAVIFGAAIAFMIFVWLPANSAYFYQDGIVEGPYKTPLGTVRINAVLPESPSKVNLYRVTPSENDMAYYSTDGNWVDIRPNVTSEAEAPVVSQTALLSYGGLPQGAKLTYVKTEYVETVNLETNQVTAKEPITTNVQFARYVDDKPVVGGGGFIYLDLGNNGEIIYLNKVWRTVAPSGSISVISASDAIDKVKRGEISGPPPKCSCELIVNKIRLGYNEKGRNVTQEYLEPVWIFSGTFSSGDPGKFFVEASDPDNPPITPVSRLAGIQANETSG
jgi:hypothetical protein